MKRPLVKGSKIVVAEGDNVLLRVVVGTTKHYVTHRGYGTVLRNRPNAISLSSVDDEDVLWARGWNTRAADALRSLAALDSSR